jgi:hypothetical protein
VYSKDNEGNFKLEIPGSLRSLYYDDIIVTHKCGYTKKFIQYIVSDALTAKSFYSIGEGIQMLRVDEYLRLKNIYYVLVKAYLDEEVKKQMLVQNDLQSKIQSIPTFSSMCDKEGYCEIARPTDTFIIFLFHNYVQERKELIKNYIANIPVDKTISIDHTFNIQKRQYTVDSRTKRHNHITNKAFMTMIYGNGHIARTSCCSNENNNSLIEGLNEILLRAKTQNVPPPQIVWVDNCCGNRTIIQVLPLSL